MAELVIICDAHLTEDIARLAFKDFAHNLQGVDDASVRLAFGQVVNAVRLPYVMALRQTKSLDAEPETAPATCTTRFRHCEEMEVEDVERTMLRKQLATSRSAFWGYSTVLAKARNALAHTEAELVTTRAMQEQRLSTLNVNNALLTMLTSAAEESSAELDAYHAKLVRKVFAVCDETYYGPKLGKLKTVMAEAQALVMDLKIIPAAIQSLDPTTRATVLSAIQKQKEALEEQEYNDLGTIVG